MKSAMKQPKKSKMLPKFKAPFAKKTIFAGILNDGTANTLKIELADRTYRDANNQYFSITHISYDIQDSMTEQEGEDRAREDLEEGESWKCAVQNDNTTKSLDDWVEDVLAMDGWQQTIGDIEDVGEHGGQRLYVRWQGCGARVDADPTQYEKLLVSKEDLVLFGRAFKDLHCVEFNMMNVKQRKLLDQVIEAFQKYKAFENKDMGIYAHCYREMGHFNIEEL